MSRLIRSTNTQAIDYVLLSYFGILLIFGLIMLTSASSVLGYDRFGDAYFFVKRQLLFGVLPGIFTFLFFVKIPFAWLKQVGLGLFGLSFLLLILVFIPGVGSDLNTFANSWIVILGFSFQPIEMMKLGFIFFIATYLANRGESILQFQRGFLPTLLLCSVPIGLVLLQPDIGGAAILFCILYGMFLVGQTRLSHMSLLAGLAVAGFLLLIVVAPHSAKRFTTFLHPELDPQGIGYHINQAYLAIGSGGFWGQGLGQSRQKFQYLPEVHADSIFAVLAEETGFLFAAGFVVLLVLIARRGFGLARRLPDEFSRLLLVGILIWILVQSFFNIMAMVGLMPITGVPLPFVSHGGTALVLNLAALGVLLNVSRRASPIR